MLLDNTNQKAGYYRVVAWQDLATLEAEVNRLLKEGYQLVGGLCVTQDQGSEIWAQAMMKKSPYA